MVTIERFKNTDINTFIMYADYYSEGFDIGHKYGEEVMIRPETILFVPISENLRAIIESEKIRISESVPASIHDRTPPALFWNENLIPSNKGTCIFETRYVTNSDDIPSISYLDLIPDRLKREFLKQVPRGFHELASKIVGREKDTRKILHAFHEFVYEHEELEPDTIGKPIEKLLSEYEETGYFYGNCKEARDFSMALCNAIGYPTKRVGGKCWNMGGHVWADVFVPMKTDYKLVPIDATLTSFGYHNAVNHLLFERTPKMSFGLISRFSNIVRGKSTPKEYKLKVERTN